MRYINNMNIRLSSNGSMHDLSPVIAVNAAPSLNHN